MFLYPPPLQIKNKNYTYIERSLHYPSSLITAMVPALESRPPSSGIVRAHEQHPIWSPTGTTTAKFLAS